MACFSLRVKTRTLVLFCLLHHSFPRLHPAPSNSCSLMPSHFPRFLSKINTHPKSSSSSGRMETETATTTSRAAPRPLLPLPLLLLQRRQTRATRSPSSSAASLCRPRAERTRAQHAPTEEKEKERTSSLPGLTPTPTPAPALLLPLLLRRRLRLRRRRCPRLSRLSAPSRASSPASSLRAAPTPLAGLSASWQSRRGWGRRYCCRMSRATRSPPSRPRASPPA